ncbi:hypothetical protein BRYFOR_08719 [Marvinbryantia formatexigens DSM 14469]|uniref:Uncharacterized protein n=1 Tax=Marvinbryantia formatexigens DSM 14469 TaxID=478749 RepID=C6LJ84_9FIRM|nr:hypothetical protein BRYFOR_08719 [Marvinbryantia formatexigens DSM 14469]
MLPLCSQNLQNLPIVCGWMYGTGFCCKYFYCKLPALLQYMISWSGHL